MDEEELEIVEFTNDVITFDKDFSYDLLSAGTTQERLIIESRMRDFIDNVYYIYGENATDMDAQEFWEKSFLQGRIWIIKDNQNVRKWGAYREGLHGIVGCCRSFPAEHCDCCCGIDISLGDDEQLVYCNDPKCDWAYR